MRGYLEVHIKEGNVSELVCPNIDCKTSLNPSQVFNFFKLKKKKVIYKGKLKL